MTTLMIKDLAAATELDRKAMASVRGGFGAGFAALYGLALYNLSSGSGSGGSQLNESSQTNKQSMDPKIDLGSPPV